MLKDPSDSLWHSTCAGSYASCAHYTMKSRESGLCKKNVRNTRSGSEREIPFPMEIHVEYPCILFVLTLTRQAHPSIV